MFSSSAGLRAPWNAAGRDKHSTHCSAAARAARQRSATSSGAEQPAASSRSQQVRHCGRLRAPGRGSVRCCRALSWTADRPVHASQGRAWTARPAWRARRTRASRSKTRSPQSSRASLRAGLKAHAGRVAGGGSEGLLQSAAPVQRQWWAHRRLITFPECQSALERWSSCTRCTPLCYSLERCEIC